MTLEIETLTIDCANAQGQANFWRDALGYEVTYTSPEGDEVEIVIEPKAGAAGCKLLFIEVPEAKGVKNRLHLDLRPDDRDAEVRRLTGLGARTVDIGQGDVTWVVMADPEGNEFCVLRALRPGEE